MKKRYPHQTINGRKDRIHRHVMEEKLGRPLKKEERVFHVDGDPLNNDPDNLVVVIFKILE